MNANLTFIKSYDGIMSKPTQLANTVNVASLQKNLSSAIDQLLTPDLQPPGSYIFALPSFISSKGFYLLI